MPTKMPTIDAIVNLFFRKKSKADAFWELAESHTKFLYNLGLRYSGSSCEAEDLVQETFFLAFKQFDQLRDERRFKSWLCTILRNTYLGNLRRDGGSKETGYDDGIDYIRALENTVERTDGAEFFEGKVESEQIQAWLDELPEKYKSPLLLYYLTEMSSQQIAAALDLPIGTVMSRLVQGRQTLKKKLLYLHMRNSRTKAIQFPNHEFHT